MKKLKFDLIQKNKNFGAVTWQAETGKVSGDDEAVSIYQKVLQKAIERRIPVPLPEPSTYYITEEPQDLLELMTVLKFGKFKLPEAIKKYWREYQEREKRHYQEIEKTSEEMRKRGIDFTLTF